MLAREISPQRGPKQSTVELKQALEKIKQTQLEVLKVLRSEGETSNNNGQEFLLGNDNNEGYNAYTRNVGNINLLKMA